jgi:hypothetical protein
VGALEREGLLTMSRMRDEDELVQRACRAYQRSCRREGAIVEFPSRYESEVLTEDGDEGCYVVLRNARGVLAAYRVTASGRMRAISYEKSYGEGMAEAVEPGARPVVRMRLRL